MSQFSVTDMNTLQLVNYAKNKEIYGIVITGTTTNGSYTQRLDRTIALNQHATHKVYLQSFCAWS